MKLKGFIYVVSALMVVLAWNAPDMGTPVASAESAGEKAAVIWLGAGMRPEGPVRRWRYEGSGDGSVTEISMSEYREIMKLKDSHVEISGDEEFVVIDDPLFIPGAAAFFFKGAKAGDVTLSWRYSAEGEFWAGGGTHSAVSRLRVHPGLSVETLENGTTVELKNAGE
jgi:hypothetical protein